MVDLWVRRIGNQLHADGNEALAVLMAMPIDKPMECVVTLKRSAKHHRLYWKICARIAQALDRDGLGSEEVSDFFKKATGHFTIIESKTFGPIERLDSISFAKMDQLAFREFFEKCIRFAYTEWGIPADVFSDLLEDKGR